MNPCVWLSPWRSSTLGCAYGMCVRWGDMCVRWGTMCVHGCNVYVRLCVRDGDTHEVCVLQIFMFRDGTELQNACGMQRPYGVHQWLCFVLFDLQRIYLSKKSNQHFFKLQIVATYLQYSVECRFWPMTMMMSVVPFWLQMYLICLSWLDWLMSMWSTRWTIARWHCQILVALLVCVTDKKIQRSFKS